jgi:hypothetical protein
MPTGVPDDWHRLATFVHISDLHIGEVDPAKGDAKVNPVAARLYAAPGPFDGLLGHHGVALEDLEAFCASLVAGGEDFRLIVTGDITRNGADVDFTNADSFLTSSLDLSPPHHLRTAGLSLGQVDLIIPGNHDHWAGSFVAWNAGPTRYGKHVTVPVPHIHPDILLANGRCISFIAVDSDSYVMPASSDRQMALGNFAKQLSDPKIQPKAHEPRYIRMMLIHHSWHQAGVVLWMRQQSKSALGVYMARHDVKAILTGHSHEPCLDHFPTGVSGIWRTELRAGSATILDSIPANWQRLLGMKALPQKKLPPNSLLVHRVYDNRVGGTQWHTQVYRRSDVSGFEELVAPKSSFLFPV